MKQKNEKSVLPTLESMPQVHGLTGMPLGIIREAKKSGCAAFITGNRIKLEPLLKWFFAEFDDAADRPPDGLPTWREALNRAQTKREELRLSVEAGELMSAAEVQQQIAQGMGITFAGLESALGELAMQIEGMTQQEITSRCRTITELLKVELRRAFSKIDGEVQNETEAVESGRQIIRREIFTTVDRIAFKERVAHEYATFRRWLDDENQLRTEQRERWIKTRVAAGLCVPDATSEEIQKFGVKTSE